MFGCDGRAKEKEAMWWENGSQLLSTNDCCAFMWKVARAKRLRVIPASVQPARYKFSPALVLLQRNINVIGFH